MKIAVGRFLCNGFDLSYGICYTRAELIWPNVGLESHSEEALSGLRQNLITRENPKIVHGKVVLFGYVDI